jgi:hypothetical protein
MNPELMIVFIPGISAILFSLGGSQISQKLQGQKWVRRFLLPSFFLLMTLIAGFSWWQGLLVFLISCFSFHLGYGDRTKWWLKILVFALFGMISVPVGVSVWNMILVLLAPILMILSLSHLTGKVFVWKIVEASWGFLIGISLAFPLSQNGIIFMK